VTLIECLRLVFGRDLAIYLGRVSTFMSRSTSPEKNRCIIVQIFDFGREPVTVRAEDKVYNGLFLAWREKLLLDRFIMTCSSSVLAMPLSSIGEGR